MSTVTVTAILNRISTHRPTPTPLNGIRRLRGNEFDDVGYADTQVGRIVASALTGERQNQEAAA